MWVPSNAPAQNNPCGIVGRPPVAWRGQVSGYEPGAMVSFTEAAWSVRALARQLLALVRHGRKATAGDIARALNLDFGPAVLAIREAAKAPYFEFPVDLANTDTMADVIRVIALLRTSSELDDATLYRGLVLAYVADLPEALEAEAA